MNIVDIDVEKIEYLNVQIQKSEINNVLREPLKKGDAFELDYIIKAVHFYNLDKQLIKVAIDATIIVIKDGKELNAGARFEIENYFRYADLKKYTRIEDDKVLVESVFAEILKGYAYSTVRGIVFSKLEGTFLEGTILPITMSTDV